VKIGYSFAVKLHYGGTLHLANNVEVAEDGLANELASGTVNLFAEAIGFFQQSGG
jgi:hypothetical protein